MFPRSKLLQIFVQTLFMQVQTHPLFLSQQQRTNATNAVAATTSLPSVLASIVLDYSLGDELIYSTNSAFAAKLADGSVVTWGLQHAVETAALCKLN